MLRLRHLYSNFDLAKEALRNWEHNHEGLDEMLGRYRISANAVYPFFQGTDVCFLRLAPVDEKIKGNIIGELEYIEYLVGAGYPALEPIASKTGDVLLELNTQWGDYYAAVFKCVKGIPIEWTDKSDEVMYNYGKTLGRLHALSAEYKAVAKKWAHTEVLQWIEGVLREYSAPEFAFLELTLIKNQLSQLPQNNDNYGLVHYDFEFDNVFYDENSKSCSVIDFDDGMYHWYALDIVQVFDCIEEELSGKACQQAKDEFLRGYQTEHCYTEEMRLSSPLMSRFVNLYGYARLIRCVAERFDEEPQWMTELREKLGDFILSKESRMTQ